MCRSLRVVVVGCFWVAAALAPVAGAEPFRYPEGRSGAGAELRYLKGVPVLTVEGTPEEMGQAVGALALKPASRVLGYPQDLLKLHRLEALWGVFVRGGNGMFRQFPADYQRELEALVKGAGVDRDRVVVGNTFFDLKKVLACSALLVGADRSATGGPLLGRNLDYPSLGYIHEHSLVTVYRPRGKHAFATVGFPGLIGALSGMNDAGFCLGILEVVDTREDEPRFDPLGVPYALCHRKLLEECTTIAEAKKVLEGLRRTTTLNLVVADRKEVAVFEVTPGRVVQRPAVEGVCVCTNHFCTETVRPEKPLNYCDSFERFQTLEQTRAWRRPLGPEDVRKQLDAANLGELTLQTMIFEPARLRLHIGLGSPPASRQPSQTLELGPLFRGSDRATTDQSGQ